MGNFMKKHRWLKAIIILLVILVVLLLAALLFLKLWPAFGGRASAEDRKNYEERAENYHDGKFYNDGDFQIVRETEQTDEYIMSGKGTKPQGEIPVAEPAFDKELPEDEVRVTWFGHSSLLLQMHGMNILIDPVFSERSSPVSFAGNKRFSHPPVKVEDLRGIISLCERYMNISCHIVHLILPWLPSIGYPYQGQGSPQSGAVLPCG